MYGWIKKALGRFPAYISGWSISLANYVDTAVYMVIAMEYLNTAFKLNLNETQRWIMGIAFIVVICLLSIRGIEVLALSATISGIILLVPFILTIIMGIPQMVENPCIPIFGSGNAIMDTNTALMIGFWLFMGYESLHSFSGEVEGSGPLLTKAFLYAVPLATFIYIVPTFVGLAVVGNWQDWSAAGPIDFVELGRLVGGNFLMILFVIAGVFGNLSVFASYMSFGSVVTSQLAEDGLFFPGLEKEHPKYGTPYRAIIASGVISIVLSQGSFADLIIIDVLLLLFPIIMIMISAIVLRIREAKGKTWNCFQFGKNKVFFCIAASAPIIIAAYAMATAGIQSLLASGACWVIGIVMYFVFPKINKKKNNREEQVK
ncbi:amino acid transporter [Aminicella lysinilytica]|uniref:Amino acid transporter n=2 Tax=Aminicella lysinilytica TaxID=433323 RepID=A0A4R6Q761_9FIRM|nr:amino acid transporter [Aminicella lysinilytica]